MNGIIRPYILQAVCLLSFIGSGVGFLLYLVSGLYFEKSGNIIVELSSMHNTEAISPAYFLIFSLLNAVSFAGVYLMWHLRKSGFYIYLVAQTAILAYPLIGLGADAFSSVSLIFTLLFIILYTRQFRNLSH